jgi:hypothetical protein
VRKALTFFLALVAGLMIRVVCLPLPGTHDVHVWKAWAYRGAQGLTTIYGTAPDAEPRLLEFNSWKFFVDYPPLSAYELGIAGKIYAATHDGVFLDTPTLTATVKSPGLVLEVALVALLLVAFRSAPVGVAQRSVLAYWINPAAILNGAVLGYLDPMIALPLVGAVLAVAAGQALLAGGLIAVAVLTKAQAVFIAPAILLGIWTYGSPANRSARIVRAIIGVGIVTATILGPIVVAGGAVPMLRAFRSLAGHNMLSGNACNLWWIFGYVIRTVEASGRVGLSAALRTPAEIVPITDAVRFGVPHPRSIGTLLTIFATAWALWSARRGGDVYLIAAVGAFLAHAYFSLSAQVHENHLYAALPLLAIAAAGRRQYVSVLVVISVIATLNLNLFYGFGTAYALPRTVTVIDATVWLSLGNCAALMWHAAVLRAECSPTNLAPVPSLAVA